MLWEEPWSVNIIFLFQWQMNLCRFSGSLRKLKGMYQCSIRPRIWRNKDPGCWGQLWALQSADKLVWLFMVPCRMNNCTKKLCSYRVTSEPGWLMSAEDDNHQGNRSVKFSMWGCLRKNDTDKMQNEIDVTIQYWTLTLEVIKLQLTNGASEAYPWTSKLSLYFNWTVILGTWRRTVSSLRFAGTGVVAQNGKKCKVSYLRNLTLKVHDNEVKLRAGGLVKYIFVLIMAEDKT